MPKLNENEGGSGEYSEHIDGGDDNKDGKVATTDNDDDDDDDDDDALLAAALAMSVSAHADPGFFPHQHTNYRTAAPDQPYSFVTEVSLRNYLDDAFNLFHSNSFLSFLFS